MGTIRELITKWKIETQAQDLEKTENFLDSLIKKADSLAGSDLKIKFDVNKKDAEILNSFFVPAMKSLDQLEKRYDSFLSKASAPKKSGKDEESGKTAEFTLKLPSPKKLEKFETQFKKLTPVLHDAEKSLGGFEQKLSSVTDKAGKANLFRNLNASAKGLNKTLTLSDKQLTKIGKNKGLKGLTSELKSSGSAASALMTRLSSGFASFENLLTVGLAATGAGMLALTKSVSASAVQLDKDSKRLGIGPEMIQGLQHSADLVGTEKDRLMDALKDFGERTQDANLLGGGEAVEAFQVMGMSIKDTNGNLKSNSQLLAESADWFAKNTDERKKILVADKLFADAGYDMIPMLNQGSQALRDQTDEARELGLIMSGDAIKASVSFEKSLTRLWAFIRGIGQQIGSKLIPVLDRLIKGWSDYGRENRELISGGLQTWLATGISIIEKMSNAIKWVIEKTWAFTEALGGSENATAVIITTLGVLAATLLAVNAQILLIPALIIGAGALIGLLIQDIVTWAEGGESMFGMVLDSAKEFFKSIENNPVGRVVKKLFDIFKLFFGDLIPELFKNSSGFLDPLLDGLKTVWDWISKIFSSFTNSAFGKLIFSGIENILGSVESGLEGSITALKDKPLPLPDGIHNSGVLTLRPGEFNSRINSGMQFSEMTRPPIVKSTSPSFNMTYAPQNNITVPENMSPEEFSKRETNTGIDEMEKRMAAMIRRDSPGMRVR